MNKETKTQLLTVIQGLRDFVEGLDLQLNSESLKFGMTSLDFLNNDIKKLEELLEEKEMVVVTKDRIMQTVEDPFHANYDHFEIGPKAVEFHQETVNGYQKAYITHRAFEQMIEAYNEYKAMTNLYKGDK